MRRAALATVLVPCMLALAACGSGGGTTPPSTASASASATPSGPSNAGLSQAQLLARIEKALGTATAMHVKGSMVDNGSTVSLDLQLNKDGSSAGTIDSAGTTMSLIVAGGVTYLQVTAGMKSMIKSQMASSRDAAESALIAKLAVGEWISSKSAIGRSMTSGMSDLTNFASLVKLIESSPASTFTYLRTSTLNGQSVAQYKDVSRDGGIPVLTMDVPLYGGPLPVKEDGGSQGSLDFTWNQPTKVSPPAAADILDLPAS